MEYVTELLSFSIIRYCLSGLRRNLVDIFGIHTRVLGIAKEPKDVENVKSDLNEIIKWASQQKQHAIQ